MGAPGLDDIRRNVERLAANGERLVALLGSVTAEEFAWRPPAGDGQVSAPGSSAPGVSAPGGSPAGGSAPGGSAPGGSAGAAGWSLLEILCHLVDEEREDFRERLRLLLEDPTLPWPGIDPQGWVSARRYAERDPAVQLAEFQRERAASLAWLRDPARTGWDHVKTHPHAPPLNGRRLLACWVAHDLLHMRQIVRNLYRHLALPHGTQALDYAGPW